MKRIGHVLHISSNRNMILKAENLPRISDKVVDENLKPVGAVFDVFGPVSSPYVAVQPHVDEPSRFIKHVLYAVPSSKPGRKRRKR